MSELDKWRRRMAWNFVMNCEGDMKGRGLGGDGELVECDGNKVWILGWILVGFAAIHQRGQGNKQMCLAVFFNTEHSG